MKSLARVALIGLLSTIAACRRDGGRHCVPGLSVQCACPDGRVGAQSCRADGTFDTCACAVAPTAPAPTAEPEKPPPVIFDPATVPAPAAVAAPRPSTVALRAPVAPVPSAPSEPAAQGAASPARLTVTATPACAISIDGRPYGYTPVRNASLASGSHEITCRRGADSDSQVINLAAGDDVETSFDAPQPVPSPARAGCESQREDESFEAFQTRCPGR